MLPRQLHVRLAFFCPRLFDMCLFIFIIYSIDKGFKKNLT